MSKEKQIDEMLNEICTNCPYLLVCEDEHLKQVCRFAKMTKVLYDAGYRKQSEGKLIIENHGDGHCFGFCGNCGARYEASNASALILQYRYCNYCGAKMKGV